MTSPRPIILVVDDDAPILLLMRNLLKEFGFEAVAAGSGEQAIAEVQKRTPDLILLDRNMPGMTGDEVLRELRSRDTLSAVPILILSGEPIGPDEIQRLGATGAVMKPFDVPSLVATIRGHVSAN
jgi:two-component system, OmpR family, phosphate regulon response regulator PhoB